MVRDDNNGQQHQELSEIIDYVKPTILIGLSGKKGIFTSQILKKMAQYNQKPIIFALSNPETNAECSLSEAIQHTNNQAIFASGTDFPDYSFPFSNEIRQNNQANNMYIFPGLELGVLLKKTKIISDFMVYEAAKVLAKSLIEEEKKISVDSLYPSFLLSTSYFASGCRTLLDVALPSMIRGLSLIPRPSLLGQRRVFLPTAV